MKTSAEIVEAAVDLCGGHITRVNGWWELYLPLAGMQFKYDTLDRLADEVFRLMFEKAARP